MSGFSIPSSSPCSNNGSNSSNGSSRTFGTSRTSRASLLLSLSTFLFQSLHSATGDLGGLSLGGMSDPYIVHLNPDEHDFHDFEDTHGHVYHSQHDQHQHDHQHQHHRKLPFGQVTIEEPDIPTTPAPQHYKTARLFGDSGPSVHEGCLVFCYVEAVARYGKEFADYLLNDGFEFEECPNDVYDEGAGLIVGSGGYNATEGGGGDGSYTVGDSSSTTERSLNLRGGHPHDHHHHHHHHDHSHNSHNSRILHRALAATNQPARIWSFRDHRTGKLLVPYSIKAGVFDGVTYSTIAAALSHIEDESGVITFVPRADFSDPFVSEYIYFDEPAQSMCAANVGKQTGTKTRVYLGWCRNMNHLGSIIHEILHALGFWHEHSRPDRDDHIMVLWGNVREGYENNFQKATEVDERGSGYDFRSIMHYPNNGFLKEGLSSKVYSTLVNRTVLENHQAMGQRVKLSQNDVDGLRLLYQCSMGPRTEGLDGITSSNLCSGDCKCWEYAPGQCQSDSDCMGDLICGDAVIPPPEVNVDAFPQPVGLTSFSCGSYCHEWCCGNWTNSMIFCPETCDSAVPDRALPEVMPTKMCRTQGDTYTSPPTQLPTNQPTNLPTNPSVAGSPTSQPTSKPTDQPTNQPTNKPTPGPTPNPTSPVIIDADWYVDWSRGGGMCVQDCVGNPPCGGKRDPWEAPYSNVKICCGTMSWKPFEKCDYTPLVTTPAPTPRPTPNPTNKPTVTPTKKPTTGPTSSPTEKPSTSPTKSPTDGPTGSPTTAQPTDPPTTSPTGKPTTSPTPNPTGSPTKKPSTGPTASPTPGPTLSPTTSPTPNPTGSPTKRPTSGPTSSPTPGPTTSPTKSPTKNPTGSPTTAQPTDRPTTQPTNPPIQTVTASSVWYPGGSSKCLNDGKKPSWMHTTYSTQDACCKAHFNWNYYPCLGTSKPSSNKWYIDWGPGKCVKDCPKSQGGSCGGAVPGSWIALHATSQICCSSHLNYIPYSQCVYNG